MDDISVVNKADSDIASISDGSNSLSRSKRQSLFDVTSNNDTSDLEDVFQDNEEFLEPANNANFIPPEGNDKVLQSIQLN
ncbi:hypothetical protein ALC60_13151 [Trachymyrmex zeteki]|uniref:Uncharacterized protein n=1 Tax=Mycetomoellerius zeteki TaxID=64791 RepID=A0A151WJ04_9HYME|nr:hypothetical protein ALC60_13151 [Trachymyrmex zeteki]